MVSTEALELYELLRNAPKAEDMDLQHQREAGEHAEDMTSEPEGVRFEDAPQWEVSGLRHAPGSRGRRRSAARRLGAPRPLGLYIGAGMQHIFPIYCGVIPESDAAVAMIGAWVRSRTSREYGGAAHNGEEDTVPAPGQDSEEASPT